ncbi:hypothetical protein B0H13DRAFT_2345766 [Mycena leptocephala]|nr:hypothetical protein B0H13DRAFT_2376456 [Mycena leptocephala]KAJ7826550.1 hypothetical protein B0H13DRAFT_2374350 [Mycena leptocephala]KAJ7840343.1 hypothetical protein B0H13DRAFT_2366318 [Mycena leptocephala]KAJ7880148.1 hypothetical protein B0H13DRAFT_2345766 [Mycena leptocephala]
MADISLEEEYVAFMLEDFPNPSSRSLPVTTVSGTTDNARSIFGVAHARLVKNEWTQLATSASITSGIASSLRLTSTGIPYVLVETSSHTASSYRSYQTSCLGLTPFFSVDKPTPEIIMSFLIMCEERKPVVPCYNCVLAGRKCTPDRVGTGCRECTLELNQACEFMNPNWFSLKHAGEYAEFKRANELSHDPVKAARWEHWNQLMPFATQIIVAYAGRNLIETAVAYANLLEKVPVEALECIYSIVLDNVTGRSNIASVFRLAIDNIKKAKAKEAAEKEAAIAKERAELSVLTNNGRMLDFTEFRALLNTSAGRRAFNSAMSSSSSSSSSSSTVTLASIDTDLIFELDP